VVHLFSHYQYRIAFIHYVDLTNQLFIIAALLGLSAGAMSSLYPDVRIALVYTTILVLPLGISLVSMGNDIHMVLAAMLTLYYITQIVIVYNAHIQNVELERQQQDVIRAQEQMLKNKETLEYFYSQAPIGVFSYDLDLKVTDCNEAFLSLFHLQKDEVVGLDLHLLPDRSPLGVIKKALTEGIQHYVGPYLSTKGLEYWVEAKTFPVHDEFDRIIGGIALIENKTKEHQAIERLKYLASHDPLTHLQNRRGFKEYMSQMTEDKIGMRISLCIRQKNMAMKRYLSIMTGLIWSEKRHSPCSRILYTLWNTIFLNSTCSLY